MGVSCSCFDGISARQLLQTGHGRGTGPTSLSGGSTAPVPVRSRSPCQHPEAAADTAETAPELQGAAQPECRASARAGGSDSTAEGASTTSDAVVGHGEPKENRPGSDCSARSGSQADDEALPSGQSGQRGSSHGLLASELIGTWRYDGSYTYQIEFDEAEQYRFREQHESGRWVSGIMRPNGVWLQGMLAFTDSEEECGTIRVHFSSDLALVISNFRVVGEDDWSDDIIAHRDLEPTKGEPLEDQEREHLDSSDWQEERCDASDHEDPREDIAPLGPEAAAVVLGAGPDAQKKAGGKREVKIPSRVAQRLARSVGTKNREDRMSAGTRKPKSEEPGEDQPPLGLRVAPPVLQPRPWCGRIFDFEACCRRPLASDLPDGEVAVEEPRCVFR